MNVTLTGLCTPINCYNGDSQYYICDGNFCIPCLVIVAGYFKRRYSSVPAG